MAAVDDADIGDTVHDDQLWQDCGGDPTLYVEALRAQGRVSPPESRAPRKLVTDHTINAPVILP